MNALLHIESGTTQQFLGILTDADLEETFPHYTNEEDLEIIEEVTPVSETRQTAVPYLQLINVIGRPISSDGWLHVMESLARKQAEGIIKLDDDVHQHDVVSIKLLLDLGNNPFDIVDDLRLNWHISSTLVWGLVYLAKPEIFARKAALS